MKGCGEEEARRRREKKKWKEGRSERERSEESTELRDATPKTRGLS